MKPYYVIVPVYNEQKHLKKLLKKLVFYTKQVIVVNDGSTDNTAAIVAQFPKVISINLVHNQGKGAAMRTGAQKAFQLKAKGIVFIDGDNQHNPKHLPEFFKRLDIGEDIIVGIRIVRAKIPFLRHLGNKLGRLLMVLLFDIFVQDLLCGYRAFSKKGYRQVRWTSNDYGAETEMMTIIGRKRLPFTTLVVDTIYLDKYKGFSLLDGLKLVIRLPYWKLRKLV